MCPHGVWQAKVVCNPTSIATIVCDIARRQLLVEYRERTAFKTHHKHNSLSPTQQ